MFSRMNVLSKGKSEPQDQKNCLSCVSPLRLSEGIDTLEGPHFSLESELSLSTERHSKQHERLRNSIIYFLYPVTSMYQAAIFAKSDDIEGKEGWGNPQFLFPFSLPQSWVSQRQTGVIECTNIKKGNKQPTIEYM